GRKYCAEHCHRIWREPQRGAPGRDGARQAPIDPSRVCAHPCAAPLRTVQRREVTTDPGLGLYSRHSQDASAVSAKLWLDVDGSFECTSTETTLLPAVNADAGTSKTKGVLTTLDADTSVFAYVFCVTGPASRFLRATSVPFT